METQCACPRCGFESKFKRAIIAHLQRKTLCTPTIQDISVDDAIKSLKRTIKYNDITYKCQFCDKVFNSTGNRSKHEKICKCNAGSDSDIDLREELLKLKSEMADIKNNKASIINNNNTTNTNSHNTTTTTNSHNNIQNNINIVNFGKEDVDFLSDAFIRNCVLKLTHGLVDLTKEIHFNPTKPEYHNVTNTNIRAPYLDVYKDGKWQHEEKNQVLDTLIKRYVSILSSHYDEHEDEIRRNIPKTKMTLVENFLNDAIDGTSESIKNLRKAIFILITNNRDMIKMPS